MAGNVNEWVSDWYQMDYYKYSPNSNPTGPESGAFKVFRGGSWDDSPTFLRSTFRQFIDPSVRSVFVGFRCVKPIE